MDYLGLDPPKNSDQTKPLRVKRKGYACSARLVVSNFNAEGFEPHDKGSSDAFAITVQGVAAGMGWTG